MQGLLELKGVNYVYGDGTPFRRHALKDIDLTIGRGEVVGLIGHTGSGKSTLIQHFNGLMRPSSGTVLFDGEDIWAPKYPIRSLRFRVGLVFQYPEYQLFEETVAKDIAFGPTNMGLAPDEIDERVYAAIQMVGLPRSIADKSPFDLSGGQKRRVAIAGILAMQPEVLVLDEPTAGLDPAGRDEIMARIMEYRERTGATIVLVTHSMEQIAQTVSRIVVMNQSERLMDGTPKEIFSQATALKAAGLNVPEITQVFSVLRKRGIALPKGVFTVDQALGELRRIKEGSHA